VTERKRFIEVSLTVFTPGLWAFYYRDSLNNPLTMRLFLPRMAIHSIPWWWDHLAGQANELRQAGFTAVWLPPVLKAASGANNQADGHGPFDDYDIGSKQQKGTLFPPVSALVSNSSGAWR
jgi:hypothetical protein